MLKQRDVYAEASIVYTKAIQANLLTASVPSLAALEVWLNGQGAWAASETPAEEADRREIDRLLAQFEAETGRSFGRAPWGSAATPPVLDLAHQRSLV
jgi:hypothetical protein